MVDPARNAQVFQVDMHRVLDLQCFLVHGAAGDVIDDGHEEPVDLCFILAVSHEHVAALRKRRLVGFASEDGQELLRTRDETDRLALEHVTQDGGRWIRELILFKSSIALVRLFAVQGTDVIHEFAHWLGELEFGIALLY